MWPVNGEDSVLNPSDLTIYCMHKHTHETNRSGSSLRLGPMLCQMPAECHLLWDPQSQTVSPGSQYLQSYNCHQYWINASGQLVILWVEKSGHQPV